MLRDCCANAADSRTGDMFGYPTWRKGSTVSAASARKMWVQLHQSTRHDGNFVPLLG